MKGASSLLGRGHYDMSSGTQGLLANDFIPFLQQTTGIKQFEENVPLIDNKDKYNHVFPT